LRSPLTPVTESKSHMRPSGEIALSSFFVHRSSTDDHLGIHRRRPAFAEFAKNLRKCEGR
jgi:hypothetical protein